MCVKVGESTNRCAGESPDGATRYSMKAFQPSVLPLHSLPSFLAQPGCVQVMATSQRFIAYYSRINQRPLGAVSGHRFLRHWAHTGIVRVRNAAAQAEGHRASSATWSWSPLPTPRHPRKRPDRNALPKKAPFTGPVWDATGGDPASRESGAGGEGGEPQEPGPQGQQMRGRCEVPHGGGKAAAGAGRPCDVNVGRPRPAGRSPAPLRSVICQGARGWYSARPALIYTFPAPPLSLLGPGKRVVTFAVNNEFWQVPLISPLLQLPRWFPGGAGRLQDPWARAAER